jgi:hypothetical protein
MKTLLLLLIFAVSGSLYSQTLDPSWKKAIVLFEIKQDTNYYPIGSGLVVFYNNFNFIVTNAHIAKKTELFLRFNLKSNPNQSLRVSINKMIKSSNGPWYFAPHSDVAVIPLSTYPEIQNKIDSIDIKPMGVSIFKTWDYLNEGDDIYILGFPIGLGTEQHYSPVYRSGIISLKENKNEFLIDANIYPGNSGGPVFLKPSVYDYRKNSIGEVTPAYLIGIVSSYIPYTDVAVSQQTQRPRIIFEENSGLAIICSTDVILSSLSEYYQKYIKVH